MDLYRAFLAIVLSLLILFGYQYVMIQFFPQEQPTGTQQQQQASEAAKQPTPVPASAPAPATASTRKPLVLDPKAKDITIDTPFYTAVIKEQGGGFKSFVLKNYRNAIAQDSGPMQLILDREGLGQQPVLFSLDNGASDLQTVYKADKTNLTLSGGDAKLVMTASLADGLKVIRTLSFFADSYLVKDEYKVVNPTDKAVRVLPALSLDNEPFNHSSENSQFLFAGPAAYVNGALVETKPKDLEKAPVTLQGKVSWAGFVDNYFMTSVIPTSGNPLSITLQGSEKQVHTLISEGIQTLAAQESGTYTYTLYFGPKKLDILEKTGNELTKSMNFGWFDVLAKPMLWLLNFFYQFSHNYGIAIILLTVLIKLAFWPITQKGLSSMKNMQKLQPKIAKLKERYKDDPTTMNQEMMTLYKTYKVNPVGGCLPMLIQLPFFFALYQVLMAAIELRHAPFMLWVNDLSAPDRLLVGFDIPYLHGLPILTLLMGASMYLQQKMTPTTGDPTQARIMQFLPVIFTFMFINFASGLVLYWFVNNLLSILQQYLINKKNKA
jgi:YidC/Oxa1 family membrane protein insertase